MLSIFSANMEGSEGRLDKISTAELQKMFEDNKCLREMHFQNGYFVIDWVRWNVKYFQM